MNNTLSQFIKVFPNVLSAEECLQLITHFEANESYWGPVVGSDGNIDVNLDIKKAKQLRLKPDTDQEVDDILFQSAGKILEKYANNVNGYYPNATVDNGYQIQKYEAGEGFYDWHIDANAASICNRTIVILWYLNTVTDGGETEFEWGKTVKPKAGSALVFPCNWLYPHRANVPKKTAKYIATTWIGF